MHYEWEFDRIKWCSRVKGVLFNVKPCLSFNAKASFSSKVQV